MTVEAIGRNKGIRSGGLSSSSELELVAFLILILPVGIEISIDRRNKSIGSRDCRP